MIVLLVIHILIAVALVGAILLQKKEGGLGGLGGGGSGGLGGLMSGRAKADGLSKVTGILATLFFVISLAMAWISTHNSGPTEIVPGATGTAIPAPAEGTAPATGTTGGAATDGGAATGGTAPAETAPAQPATPAVPAGD
jgi:preprotein translocase subunit SecG